jgi:hypothetical protein
VITLWQFTETVETTTIESNLVIYGSRCHVGAILLG